MDNNKWSFWISNTEHIRNEILSDKIKIDGMIKREQLEFEDLENQHNEQKDEKSEKNTFSHSIRTLVKDFNLICKKLLGPVIKT